MFIFLRAMKASSQSFTMAVLVFLGVLFLNPAIALAADKNCAIVVIHGKWGTVQSVQQVARKYAEVCDFKALEMPWSQRRNYDQSYSQALNSIEKQVKDFREQGYHKVFLMGHSFGANAVLAYASTNREKIDGLVALAPGHDPLGMYERGLSEQADRAQALVNAGNKDEMVSITDINQGVKRVFRMTAEVAWSYFDPKGLGNMTMSASHFQSPIPTLIVVGDGEMVLKNFRSSIFDKLPQNMLNLYLEVSAGHKNTPVVSVNQVMDWIKKIIASGV